VGRFAPGLAQVHHADVVHHCSPVAINMAGATMQLVM